jgi:hypothetical protein
MLNVNGSEHPSSRLVVATTSTYPVTTYPVTKTHEMATAKRLVVCGGNGFLGSRICKYAVQRGWDVTSIRYVSPKLCDVFIAHSIPPPFPPTPIDLQINANTSKAALVNQNGHQ